jgi:hypothetical protein
MGVSLPSISISAAAMPVIGAFLDAGVTVISMRIYKAAKETFKLILHFGHSLC